MTDAAARAARVRLACFDVDGVLTDGRLYFTDEGTELKAFDVRDGHGLKMLQASGVKVAVITSRKSRLVEHRSRNLGLDYLFQGVENKRAAWEKLLGEIGIAPEQSAFMGDDVIDLPVMIRCGFAITVPDAPLAVAERAHYATRHPGGRGAVREACEFIMTAQGTLDAVLRPYLE